MPKDYSQGKIYQMESICDHEEGEVYIGSTCQKFISRRLAEHIYDYKKWKNGKHPFVSSFLLFDRYGIDNVRIVLLESCPCINNDELRAREAYYQKSMKCVNKYIAFRSEIEKIEKIKQYNIEHHDTRLEYYKQYNIEHHDTRLEYYKQYYIEHREEQLKFNKQNYIENRDKILENQKQYYQDTRDERLEHQKEYYIEHHEEILEKHKQYYQENKKEISEKKKEKITCECGRTINKYQLKKHQRSDIHKDLMLQLTNEK